MLARSLKQRDAQNCAVWRGCKNRPTPAWKTNRVPGRRSALLTFLEQMNDSEEIANYFPLFAVAAREPKKWVCCMQIRITL